MACVLEIGFGVRNLHHRLDALILTGAGRNPSDLDMKYLCREEKAGAHCHMAGVVGKEDCSPAGNEIRTDSFRASTKNEAEKNPVREVSLLSTQNTNSQHHRHVHWTIGVGGS